MSLRVVLADDHMLVRQGMRTVLEQRGFEIVGEASNGREAVGLTAKLHPDVTVLDVGMPILNGIDAAREIAKSGSRTKTLLLTMYTDDHYVLASLRAGVRGYVLKSRSADELVQAIHDVCNGEIYLTPGVSETVVQAYLANTSTPAPELSDREHQVLQLVAEGKTTKEIATLFDLSIKTIDSHRANIMEKLGIHDMPGLVRYAIRIGLIQA